VLDWGGSKSVFGRTLNNCIFIHSFDHDTEAEDRSSYTMPPKKQ